VSSLSCDLMCSRLDTLREREICCLCCVLSGDVDVEVIL
jgi:hypothetical protein